MDKESKDLEELRKIASDYCGELLFDHGKPYIRIDTGDRTSKENYDDLMELRSDIAGQLEIYEISEIWADHDTQIIEFSKPAANSVVMYPCPKCGELAEASIEHINSTFGQDYVCIVDLPHEEVFKLLF
jgi:hypothetical protein